MRHGVELGELLNSWQLPGSRRSGWKPFLHHISKNKPQPHRTIALTTPKKLPRILTVSKMRSIVDACDRLRDRFLLCLLWESGVRIGEALGLRHADITAAERQVTIMPRVNGNGAQSKSGQQRTIPVSAELIRLWGDYLHTEYGDLDLLTELLRLLLLFIGAASLFAWLWSLTGPGHAACSGDGLLGGHRRSVGAVSA